MNRTGINPFNDIKAAIHKGATIDTKQAGFQSRNSSIAKESDILIAFSWSEGKEPTKGGTYDTWRKCKTRRKIHISLHDLKNKPNRLFKSMMVPKKNAIIPGL